jgi:hypothetical protein
MGNWRVPCSCLCVETPAARSCPQVCYTAPAIRPVRVHKFPWQTSQCGMGSIPYRMYDICRGGKNFEFIGGSSTKSLPPSGCTGSRARCQVTPASSPAARSQPGLPAPHCSLDPGGERRTVANIAVSGPSGRWSRRQLGMPLFAPPALPLPLGPKMPFRPIGAPFTFFNTRNCSW